MKQNAITLVNLHKLIMIRYCIGLLNEGPQKNLSDIFHTFWEAKKSTKVQPLHQVGEEHILYTAVQCGVWLSLRKLPLELSCDAQFITDKAKRPFL